MPGELRRYLGHFAPFWFAFVIAAVLLSVNSFVPGAAVLLLERTLDDVLVGGKAGHLAGLCIGFAALYILSGVLSVLRTWLTKHIAWKVTASLRRSLHAHYLALSVEQQQGVGHRIAALTHDVDELQYGVSAIVTAFRNPFSLIVLAGTAFWLAPSLAPWTFLIVPALLLTTLLGGRRLRHLGQQVRQARAELSGLLTDQLGGLRTIQGFGVHLAEEARFGRLVDGDRRAKLQLEVERVLPSAIVQVLAAIGVGLLLWVGGRQVLRGELMPGELVGFAVALGLMNRPLAGLSEVWSLMQRSLAALEKVYSVLDTAPLIADEGQETLPQSQLSVEWQQVSARYLMSDRAGPPVLSQIDLVAEPGKITALVGPSGGGKSTLLKLAARHVEAESGRVVIGGVDIRQVRLASLRQEVAVVWQDDVLFARTVFENIAFSRAGATRDDVEKAAKQAGAHSFIAALPQGYDTPILELGSRLSGGERQRLCLARALLGQASLLLLDEATNQVDAETERAILELLCQLRGRCTIVVVAHNLATTRVVDHIAVIEGGEVVEEGTPADLVEKDGPYKALCRAAEGKWP
ncbi:MAG: ABC transporter ATP-binding protein [Proteobacteria bacterium]|nr:ABC transporter ATP-binding protein [Pseudomonadota bacterium]